MDNNLRGILCVIAAMMMFSVQDTLFKILSDDASILQIVVLRGLIGGVLIVGYLQITNQPVRFGTAYPVRTVLRATMFLFGFMCFYLSLSLMPIAEATALFFVSPFFVTILSVFFFKAKIGIHRISAIVVGFVGMLLVMKPNPEIFNWASLLPIFFAFTYALSMMIAKQTQEKDTGIQQALHMYIAAIVLGSLVSAFLSGATGGWADNPDLAFILRPWQFEWNFVFLLTCIIAIVGSIGIILIITAYRIAEPSIIAPFEYSVLLSAVVVGYVIFGESIDGISFMGMGFIVGSGAYVFCREKSRLRTN